LCKNCDNDDDKITRSVISGNLRNRCLVKKHIAKKVSNSEKECLSKKEYHQSFFLIKQEPTKIVSLTLVRFFPGEVSMQGTVESILGREVSMQAREESIS